MDRNRRNLYTNIEFVECSSAADDLLVCPCSTGNKTGDGFGGGDGNNISFVPMLSSSGAYMHYFLV